MPLRQETGTNEEGNGCYKWDDSNPSEVLITLVYHFHA